MESEILPRLEEVQSRSTQVPLGTVAAQSVVDLPLELLKAANSGDPLTRGSIPTNRSQRGFAVVDQRTVV